MKEGDVVFVKSLGYDASVVKLLKKKKRLKVKTGSMEMEVPLSDVGIKKGIGAGIGRGRGKDRHANVREETVASQINIIGLRVDEALPHL